MKEFFNTHSSLTAEPDMVKVDNRYFPLSDYLTLEEAQRILMILLENKKAREVITKMKAAGILGAIAIVRRFKACNWDSLDLVPDIDDQDQPHFEYVNCQHKGANRKCPFMQPGDTKPYCIIKSLFNIPNNALCNSNKRIA